MRAVVRLGLLLLLIVVAARAAGDVPVPPLRAHVTDLAGVLDDARRAALEQKLVDWEKRTGSQLAVLTVPTTAPESIEQYSIRVTDQWKLGRKGVDDGVLLLVARDDRRLRLEVGRGFEGVLPDAVAARVIEEVIRPRFAAGDLPGGIEAGIDRVMRLIEGEPLPPPRTPGNEFSGGNAWAPAIFAAFFLGGFARSLLGALLGALSIAGLAAALAWFLGGSVLAIIGSAVAAFLVTLFAAPLGAGMPGGWHSGRYRGGGWGGGGFGGGGGFSGGGGGFSGGGASGRW